MSKYHATKTTIDGITFDSKKEASRYCELKYLEKANVIYNLQLQVPFILIEPREQDGHKLSAIKYIADFVYYQDGKTVVEDVKGVKTAVYKLKKRLMLEKYNICIKEV